MLVGRMASSDEVDLKGLLLFTLSAIGLGAAVSLIAGVVAGLAWNDMARGIGVVSQIGLYATAVVVILLIGVRTFRRR